MVDNQALVQLKEESVFLFIYFYGKEESVDTLHFDTQAFIDIWETMI